MDLGKIRKIGLTNLGFGGIIKKGEYQASPPLMGCLGCAERMQVQDVLEGGEDKDAQKARACSEGWSST